MSIKVRRNKKKHRKTTFCVYFFLILIILKTIFPSREDNLDFNAKIIYLLIFPVVSIYGLKRFCKFEIQTIKNAGTIISLYNELDTNKGFNSSRYHAINSYNDNTFLTTIEVIIKKQLVATVIILLL